MSLRFAAQCGTCGFTREYDTPARADYALRQHSCDKHLAAVQRAAAAAAREALVDRTPKTCTHRQAEHEHGSHAMYVLDRCRCRPCVQANTAYERTRSRQAAYGRWQPYVDAEPARQHVLQLRAAGLGLKTIAARSGVPHGGLSKLIYGDRSRGRGPSKRVRAQTAERLLALQHDAPRAPGALVDATASWQAVQGLVALGYPFAWIARQLGQTSPALQLGEQQVQAATETAVLALAQEVGDQPGPSVRARRYAQSRGWLTPAQQYAAQLGDLDDEPVIDDVAVERTLAGETVPLTADERLEVARRLLARGDGPSAIAKTLHVNGSTAQTLARRAREASDQITSVAS